MRLKRRRAPGPKYRSVTPAVAHPTTSTPVQVRHPVETSGQRILTKGRIARERIFHGGKCNVTLISQEHCSRLPQSRCHAAIDD